MYKTIKLKYYKNDVEFLAGLFHNCDYEIRYIRDEAGVLAIQKDDKPVFTCISDNLEVKKINDTYISIRCEVAEIIDQDEI
jgi:hypothetical protein